MDPPDYLKPLLLLAFCIRVDSAVSTKHDVFDELISSDSHDKRIVPLGKDGGSQTIEVSLYVLQVLDITETR